MTPTSFKTLHSFTVNLDQEVTETNTRTENGQEITVKSKVTKSVPHTIVLKEPSRKERQELTLFQQITYNKAIELGLLPKLIMQQKLGKDSGALTEDEDKNIATMTARLQELSSEYLRLSTDKTPDTDEVKARKEKLLQDYGTLYKKVEDLNTSYQSVYAYTADTYTQNKTLSWLLLFLTYTKSAPDAKPEPLFAGSDFASKETHAEDMDDAGSPLWKALMADDKLTTYWQLFLFNRANKTEDFVRIEDEWKRRMAAAEKMKEDAKKVEETPASVTPPAAPDSITVTTVSPITITAGPEGAVVAALVA